MVNKVPEVNFIYRIDGKYVSKNTDDIFANKK